MTDKLKSIGIDVKTAKVCDYTSNSKILVAEIAWCRKKSINWFYPMHRP